MERLYRSEGERRNLLLAGFYGPENSAPIVAVNPDAAAEADIAHMPIEQFAAALAIKTDSFTAQPANLEIKVDIVAAEIAGANIGRTLLVVALLMFVAETIFARLFSVYR